MTKGELRQIYDLKKNITDLEEKLFRLESAAERTTPVLSDMPKGRGNVADCRAELISTMLDLQKEIDFGCKQIRIKAINLESEIHKKNLSEKEADLIRLRYTDCNNWATIGTKLKRCPAQIHNIHARALKLLIDS